MYYLITVYRDNGATEVLKMKKMDRELISLYRHCIGSSDNKNLLIEGMLLEWQDKTNDLAFLEVTDLVERFEFLNSTDSQDDYKVLLLTYLVRKLPMYNDQKLTIMLSN